MVMKLIVFWASRILYSGFKTRGLNEFAGTSCAAVARVLIHFLTETVLPGLHSCVANRFESLVCALYASNEYAINYAFRLHSNLFKNKTAIARLPPVSFICICNLCFKIVSPERKLLVLKKALTSPVKWVLCSLRRSAVINEHSLAFPWLSSRRM